MKWTSQKMRQCIDRENILKLPGIAKGSLEAHSLISGFCLHSSGKLNPLCAKMDTCFSRLTSYHLSKSSGKKKTSFPRVPSKNLSELSSAGLHSSLRLNLIAVAVHWVRMGSCALIRGPCILARSLGLGGFSPIHT